MIINKNIDGGKGFDWGRTSNDYAKFRDIYPDEFYQYLIKNGICTKRSECFGYWHRNRCSAQEPI